MISAREQFDVALVRRVIEEHGLDPVPQADPAAVSAADGARLTIETYSWGRVFFAEHRSRSLGVTWVELGENRPELPSWAAVLRGRVDPPPCFGWWRPIRDCDGKGTAAAPPCWWRGRCVALQRRALRRVNVAALELDPVAYAPRLTKAREGVGWADLDADVARRPPPAPPSSGRSSSGWTKEQIANEERCYELARFLITRTAEIGGWPVVETRFRCSVGRCFVEESWFGRDNPRRLLALFLRVPPVPGRSTARTLAVLRTIVGQKYGILVRIWTASPDPVAAQLPAGMEVRPVKKDRARLSVSVSVSTREEAEAVARAIVFVVDSGLLTSRGSVEANLPRALFTNAWSTAAKRRGRRP